VYVLLFHEEEKKEEVVVGVVVGMEYLVYLPDVGMERVGIEEEEEEGNHLRKEPVPYCVNYKESVQ
jgi:hypothetical protein